MLPSSMLLLNLIPLIDVTFSTPTPVCDSYNERVLGEMVTVSRMVAHLLPSRWREKYRPRCFGLPGPGGYTKSLNGGYHGVVLLHCLCRHFSLCRRTTYLSSSVVARDPYL